MKIKISTFGAAFALLIFQTNALAIEFAEISAYLNSPSIGASSLQDVQFPTGSSSEDQFADNNLSLLFESDLDSNNFGSFTWTISNNGPDLSDVIFFGFLDAHIDEAINEYYNEYGDESGLILGSGSNDNLADYWEIDEPGLLFGDIIDNLFIGNLDNFNNVPQGLEEDVSLALGFDIGSFMSNDILTVTFNISPNNNSGLGHFDPDSNTGFYFNGFASIEPGTPQLGIPEPSTILLMIFVILYLTTIQNHKPRNLFSNKLLKYSPNP